MDTIAKFETRIGENIVTLTLSFQENPEQLETAKTVPMTLTIETLSSRKDVNIDVDLASGEFSVAGLSSFSPLETCLAACAVSSVAKPIIECFNSDPAKFKACLRKKGVSLLADALLCATECAMQA